MTRIPSPNVAAIGEEALSRRGVPSAAELWREPLPALRGRPVTRWVCRSLVRGFRHQIREIEGLPHVASDRDPFIVALNHSQGPEAVLVPAWLCFHRGGRMVHFMADWNFLLWPGLGWVIRLHRPIVVTHKEAKPKFLNLLRPWFEPNQSPFAAAREILSTGRSVGVFPEGTVNRHPSELLRGQRGVARLAINAQVPVVPGGIRFPEHRGAGPIGTWEPLSIEFGPLLTPPKRSDDPRSAVASFHEQIMSAISTLSGKQWQPHARRTKYAFPKA